MFSGSEYIFVHPFVADDVSLNDLVKVAAGDIFEGGAGDRVFVIDAEGIFKAYGFAFCDRGVLLCKRWARFQRALVWSLIVLHCA